MEEPPQRITWRLASAFTGKAVGAACYAPNHPDIRAAYGDDVLDVEVIPQDEEVAVQDDDEDDD
jgi:hypothetical protein